MEGTLNNTNEITNVEKLENEKDLETAELSEVDLGNKDQVNFDELISFFHTHLNYSIVKTYWTLKEFDNNIFCLLISNEFLLAWSNITKDSLNIMSYSEIVKTLKINLKVIIHMIIIKK